MNKPTVHDIAKEAGVSLATVDRVLNARAGVRDKTIAKVQAAVARLGYVRDTYAANLAKKRQYRFAFVLPEGPSQFVDTLAAAIEEAYASQVADRTLIEIIRVPLLDPHVIVRNLLSLQTDRLDGVALMVPETPQVRDAVARLKHEGISVVTLVSDLPNSQRDYFIGTNSVAAGRTAGLLMGRFVRRGGEVLVVSNSMRSRDSLERRLGFDEVISFDFNTLTTLPSVEFFDDPARMEGVIAEVIARRPDLVGVYSMGSGNKAMLNALRRTGRLGDLVVIAHELSPTTRKALVENEVAAVIAQNVGHLSRSALRVLRNLSDNLPIYEAQERVRIEILVRENLV
ncbi:transcriptional regulator, LacI family [Roseovarius azorensis]|uniref:Transcriptional regulator, LacI family n=1 Tax=Roseovarius azorensis TaxID=1287727 RepID=A0A1H7T4S6_9RHOB|nr:LacI family DNA-binding transcriptional regulator [Roseovarius azorensis]SEL79738.1 transcriptional regulator, LacI family [Roseovarius azorensis]